MSKIRKLFFALCSGTADKNMSFAELQIILQALGFALVRVKGDHFIYAREDIPEIINIQPDTGDSSKAKSIQVKQVRKIVQKYGLEVR